MLCSCRLLLHSVPHPTQPWQSSNSKAVTKFHQFVLSQCVMRVCYSKCKGVCWQHCLHAGKRAAVFITVAAAVITNAYQLGSAEEQNHIQKLQRWHHLFHRRSVNLGRGQVLKMNETCLISSVIARSLLMKPTLSHLHGTKFKVAWKPHSQPAMLIRAVCIEDCETICFGITMNRALILLQISLPA